MCCSSAWWHLLLKASSAHWWGYSHCSIRESLIPTTCLYYDFLHCTLSARQHLSLGWFSVRMPVTRSYLMFHFLLSVPSHYSLRQAQLYAEIWQWHLTEHPGCVFLPGRWKILLMTTGEKQCSYAGCDFHLGFVVFTHLFVCWILWII